MLDCYNGSLRYKYLLTLLLILAITILAWSYTTDRLDRELQQRFDATSLTETVLAHD